VVDFDDLDDLGDSIPFWYNILILTTISYDLL
jgi:hypothetical protein